MTKVTPATLTWQNGSGTLVVNHAPHHHHTGGNLMFHRAHAWTARAAGRVLAPACAARRFVKTGIHAAKFLPAIWRALPLPIRVIIAVALVVKFTVPVDFGTDETLLVAAALLICLTRWQLVKALYREASAGKPTPCWCAPCRWRMIPADVPVHRIAARPFAPAGAGLLLAGAR